MSPPPSNVVMSRVCELQGMKASCLIRDRVRRIGGGRKEERGGGAAWSIDGVTNL